MKVEQLTIQHVRSCLNSSYRFHPQFNVISGPNGSGKTTLLEALYMLSTGHSFRTRETHPLIMHGKTQLNVFATMVSGDSVSVQKSLAEATKVKVNHQPCLSSSMLTQQMPCQVFHHELFQIIDAGPAVRRGVLDWGMFHVKHSYLSLLKEYRRVLKQRNALLRQKAIKTHFSPWDKLLVELSYEMDAQRSQYVDEWMTYFQQTLKELSTLQCQMTYYKGWDKRKTGRSLMDILNEQYPSDCQQQYTHSGAHQADLILNLSNVDAKATLSRGQQKVLLIALKLAQTQLLQKHCLYLFDDIQAELDREHMQRLLTYLEGVNGQVFLTSLDAETIPMDSSREVVFLRS